MAQAIYNTKFLQKNIFPDKKIIFVLGDMRELGEGTSKHHRELTGLCENVAEIFTI